MTKIKLNFGSTNIIALASVICFKKCTLVQTHPGIERPSIQKIIYHQLQKKIGIFQDIFGKCISNTCYFMKFAFIFFKLTLSLRTVCDNRVCSLLHIY